jgi:hypothetical protein
VNVIALHKKAGQEVLLPPSKHFYVQWTLRSAKCNCHRSLHRKAGQEALLPPGDRFVNCRGSMPPCKLSLSMLWSCCSHCVPRVRGMCACLKQRAAVLWCYVLHLMHQLLRDL